MTMVGITLAFAAISLLTLATEVLADEEDVVLLTGGAGVARRSVEIFGRPECSPSLSLPDDRFYHTSNYIDNKVLICGGGYKSGWGGIITTCLQLVDGEFIFHSRLNEKRRGHFGVMLNGKLTLIGGSDSQYTMETLNGTTWTPGQRMKHGVTDGCVVALNKTKAMVISGISTYDKYWKSWRWSYDDVLTYDGEANWTTKMDLPETRHAQNCLKLGDDRVLAIGGRAHGRTLDTVVLYNGNSWEELPGRLNIARSEGQLVNVNGRILYFGGMDDKGNSLDTVEEFDEDTGTWTLLQQTMERPKAIFSAVVVPGSAVGCHTQK